MLSVVLSRSLSLALFFASVGWVGHSERAYSDELAAEEYPTDKTIAKQEEKSFAELSASNSHMQQTQAYSQAESLSSEEQSAHLQEQSAHLQEEGKNAVRRVDDAELDKLRSQYAEAVSEGEDAKTAFQKKHFKSFYQHYLKSPQSSEVTFDGQKNFKEEVYGYLWHPGRAKSPTHPAQPAHELTLSVDPKKGLEWNSDPIFANTAFTVEFLQGEKSDLFFSEKADSVAENQVLVKRFSGELIVNAENLKKATVFQQRYEIPRVKLIALTKETTFPSILVEYEHPIGGVVRGWTGATRLQLLEVAGEKQVPNWEALESLEKNE